MENKRKAMLMILDGWGIGKEYEGNAIYLANTPNMDLIKEKFPGGVLHASGKYVGLPEGQMGNSEVGHLTIGSGRVIYQDFSRVSNGIKDGSFFENEELLKALKNVKEKKSSLHIMGLVSFGGVHSHFDHLIAILKAAKKNKIQNVYVHAFLDGRDVPVNSGIKDIALLEEKMKEIGVGKILSISGRYYAMDRDKRWERIQKAYDAIVFRKGNISGNCISAIQKSYDNNITDEFFVPTVINSNIDKERNINITDDDSIIFFNFRPDRARQISRAFTDQKFSEFAVAKYSNLNFTSMTEYEKNLKNINIMYKPEEIKNTLGEVISKNSLKQLRIAETEKYAHVTFFFNGGKEKENKGEDRILIPSPKVATYDLKPEMSSDEVAKTVIEKMNENIYDLIILNFANPDMVGHTAKIPAVIKAIEKIDFHVGNIAETAIKNNYNLIITADHGNAEKLIDEKTNMPFTSHTNNLVPYFIVSEKRNLKVKGEGSLKDLSPTILDILNIKTPKDMEGESLII